jgi:hypothetical protein
MIRNLDQALLYLFSSVSVEIALWSHVFLELDGFPSWKSCFSKNLCYGTLYCPWKSINVNVFWEIVGLVPFTDRRVRCWDRNLAVSISYLAFSTPKSANPDWMAHYRIIGNTLGYWCMQLRHQCTWTSLSWTWIWSSWLIWSLWPSGYDIELWWFNAKKTLFHHLARVYTMEVL